jgi:hypothetical protein
MRREVRKKVLVDKHIKFEEVDLERLRRFCIHRGDISFFVNQALKIFLVRLEEKEELSKIKSEEVKEDGRTKSA